MFDQYRYQVDGMKLDVEWVGDWVYTKVSADSSPEYVTIKATAYHLVTEDLQDYFSVDSEFYINVRQTEHSTIVDILMDDEMGSEHTFGSFFLYDSQDVFGDLVSTKLHQAENTATVEIIFKRV